MTRLARICSFVIGMSSILLLADSLQGAVDWEDPQIIGRNKEDAHCTLMPYANAKNAVKATRQASRYHKSLNGNWKFHWVKTPADRPMDFYKVDYDVSKWDQIPVPANWQISRHLQRQGRRDGP